MIELTDLIKLEPTAFEELVCQILRREGFINVDWYGKHGHDDGRDITCQKLEPIGTRVIQNRCIVQCKRYSGSVGKSILDEDLSKVKGKGFDVFILATTGTLSAGTKDWLSNNGRNKEFKIILWEAGDIITLLEKHHDLAVRNFSVPPDPHYLLKRIAEEYREISSADKYYYLRQLEAFILMRLRWHWNTPAILTLRFY